MNVWGERLEPGPVHRGHPSIHYDCVVCLPPHGSRTDEFGWVRRAYLTPQETEAIAAQIAALMPEIGLDFWRSRG